ncbi:DUF1788 domain-containing protein [Oenococcus sp.]|uniref:DUF1788 domain-containing protein n=1 Tax=Oenococcus sp. TaxID=1979414 RepID=UPI0039ED38F9
MTKLNEDLKQLKRKIRDRDFQTNHGLANEVGYYIFQYDAKDELFLQDAIKSIASDSTIATIGANIKVFNLFNIMIQEVDKFGYRDAFIDMEANSGIDEVIDQMNNIMEMNEEQNLIVRDIDSKLTDEPTIIFLTGVGEVFPLIRAHKVLNTMNQVIDRYPVVMFYPGKYDSVQLQMFGELHEDNYYRAFPLN